MSAQDAGPASEAPAEVSEEAPEPTTDFVDGEASPGLSAARRHAAPALLILLGLAIYLSARRKEGESPKRLARLGAALVAIGILLGGFQLAQSEGDGDSTATRTRRGECSFEVQFGIRIVGPGGRAPSRDFLFTALDGGIWLHSNGHVEVLATEVGAEPVPSGTLTFEFFRGADGSDRFARIRRRIETKADLHAFNTPRDEGGSAPDAPSLSLPDAMDAAHRESLDERIRVVARYIPDGETDPCPPISDEVAVQWRWNGLADVGSSFAWRPFKPLRREHPVGGSRSRVTVGETIVEETTGIPGSVNMAHPTTAYFKVEDPFRCCGQADTPYTIVQFVRHRWRVGPSGPLKCDEWNLDGPESQSERHAAGQEFDPTFTTDPKHGESTEGQDNGLVNASPWDSSGGSAIVVKDFPGLLSDDHDFFLQRGGLIEWEFVTLLVCRADRGSAASYLRSSHARAMTHFTVRRQYPGGGDAPRSASEVTTDAPAGAPAFFDPCRNLRDVLSDLGLTAVFQAPRSHKIALRQGGANCP